MAKAFAVEAFEFFSHRWWQEYGGAKEETVKRLEEMEKENERLKRSVAEMAVDNAMLKELAEGEW